MQTAGCRQHYIGVVINCHQSIYRVLRMCTKYNYTMYFYLHGTIMTIGGDIPEPEHTFICTLLQYSISIIELPIYFHIRGCFFVEQSLGGGCYRNHRFIDQYKDSMSKYLEGTGSVQLGDFNGVLCINGDNNVDPWKTNLAIRHNHCWVTYIVLIMVYCLS